MKYLSLILLIAVVSCKGINNSRKMEGVYVTKTVSEFGSTDDTLILRKVNEGNGIYQIQKHAGVTQMLDGRVFPRQYKTETWTLDYNAGKQIFTELSQGRIIIWSNHDMSLLIGSRHYKRIGN